MNFDMEHTAFESIVNKYLMGETTPAEDIELLAVLKEDEEKKEEFIVLSEQYRLAGIVIEKDFSVDTNAAFDTFKKQTNIGNKKKPNTFVIGLLIAASFALFFIVHEIGFKNTEITNKRISATDSSVMHSLPDQSNVWLEQQSVIVYNDNFNNERQLFFEGQGHFSVKNDKSHPFIVQSPHFMVKVTGTEFLIIDDSISEAQVVVNEGSVEVLNKETNEKVQLSAGEKICVTEFKKSENTDVNYLSRKTGKLQFDDTPLSVVFEDIERHFNIQIEVKDSIILTCPFTASYSNNSLDEILGSIMLTFELQINKQDNSYVVTGDTGCSQ